MVKWKLCVRVLKISLKHLPKNQRNIETAFTIWCFDAINSRRFGAGTRDIRMGFFDLLFARKANHTITMARMSSSTLLSWIIMSRYLVHTRTLSLIHYNSGWKEQDEMIPSVSPNALFGNLLVILFYAIFHCYIVITIKIIIYFSFVAVNLLLLVSNRAQEFGIELSMIRRISTCKILSLSQKRHTIHKHTPKSSLAHVP